MAAVAAVVVGGTVAFFSDTETSNANIFTAGSIDLTVDHTKATYDGQPCVSNCTETGNNLITNGGFETPDLATGTWAVYPDASQTGWTVESGDGLEIQDHAAGDPHTGGQLAELDSNNSSAISQTLSTVAGGKYRLTFWHSPRPNVPAGDNVIGFNIKVVSDNSVILSDTVGAAAVGGGNTVWTKYVYDFIAVNSSTKVVFTDLGSSNNSYGGYLDDISVFALNCTETGFPYGGVCHLWNEKNLGQGDTFWNFPDVKPGDYGTNVISLHVTSNDAFACLLTKNIVDNDNAPTDPELAVPDPTTGPGLGELSQFVKMFAWNDIDNDGVYDGGAENVLLPQNTPIANLNLLNLSLTTGTTKYVGLAWCAGTQAVPVAGSPVACDGSGMGNIAQTDSFTADVVAYAEQQRNNPNFSCSNVVLTPPVVGREE